MNDRTRNDFQQRVIDVIAENYPQWRQNMITVWTQETYNTSIWQISAIKHIFFYPCVYKSYTNMSNNYSTHFLTYYCVNQYVDKIPFNVSNNPNNYID